MGGSSLVVLLCILANSLVRIGECSNPKMSTIVGDVLIEPDKIYVDETGANATLYVRLCTWTVYDEVNDYTVVSMTRYCYCNESFSIDPDNTTCTSPGPTFEMHDETNITITIVNELVGSDLVYGPDSSFWNEYKDMDTTNLHVHGLHVSPFIDDILVKIPPGSHHNYSYKIPYHYPGTFWYHAHHHGSTTWQVGMGLHGSILMRQDGDMTDMYEETLLQFTWQYIIPYQLCYETTNNATDGECPSDSSEGSRFVLAWPAYYDYFDFILTLNLAVGSDAEASYFAIVGNLADNSLCDVYCQMPNNQRNVSGYVYDLETDLSPDFNSSQNIGIAKYFTNLVRFFVNGQLEPVINDMKVGVFRRLRMVNSLSNWYIQFLLPNETCDWYLIATDGVYIGSEVYMNYNLNNETHNSQYLQAPGGRVDMMVRCNVSGTYHIYATNSTINDPNNDDGLKNFQRVYEGTLLFSIQVNDVDNYTDEEIATMSLPSHYPAKPVGSYIQDLSSLNASQYSDECECNYNNSIPSILDNCVMEFSITSPLNPPRVNSAGQTVAGHAVNLRQFDLDESEPYPHIESSLTLLEKDKAYEFIIDNDVDILTTAEGQPPLLIPHVYHQHINPFQVPESIGHKGFIALPLTWWDTLGNLPSLNASYDKTAENNGFIRMRFWTRTFDGLIILHCHLLQHEDEGMMGFYNILKANEVVNASDCPNRVEVTDLGTSDPIATTPASGDSDGETEDDDDASSFVNAQVNMLAVCVVSVYLMICGNYL